MGAAVRPRTGVHGLTRRRQPHRAEDRKGDIVASYYVVVYVGTAIPVIGAGVLTEVVGLLTAIQVFGYVMITICLAGLAALLAELRLRRRSRRTETAPRDKADTPCRGRQVRPSSLHDGNGVDR
jgi:hypothetical protein